MTAKNAVAWRLAAGLLPMSALACNPAMFDKAVEKAPVRSLGVPEGFGSPDVGRLVLPLPVPASAPKVSARMLVAGTQPKGGIAIVDFDQAGGQKVYSAPGDLLGPFLRDVAAPVKSAATIVLSRVVNRGLVIGAYVDAMIERGDPSKPYRYIPIFSVADAANITRGATVEDVVNHRMQARPLEQLPLERERYALSGRLGWRGDSTTLRLEERLYVDTWGLKATTTDVRYFIDLSERVMVWPHLRVHAQSGVNFWERAYTAVDANHLPAYRTGDRELGPLTNLGGGGGMRFGLGKAGAVNDWALSFTLDGTWTSFADALYVKDRFSGLAASVLEVTF
jgi:hypothetical protein